MKYFIMMLLAALSVASLADEMDAMESRKIDYLIASLENLENAEFIRNGKAYGAAAAADHLRLKRRKAGSRIKTAEDFIRYCATGSSMSGEPYRIRFPGGREVLTEEYLRRKLLEFKSGDDMDNAGKT